MEFYCFCSYFVLFLSHFRQHFFHIFVVAAAFQLVSVCEKKKLITQNSLVAIDYLFGLSDEKWTHEKKLEKKKTFWKKVFRSHGVYNRRQLGLPMFQIAEKWEKEDETLFVLLSVDFLCSVWTHRQTANFDRIMKIDRIDFVFSSITSTLRKSISLLLLLRFICVRFNGQMFFVGMKILTHFLDEFFYEFL